MLPYQTLWGFDCGASIISVSGTPNLFSIVAGTVGRKVFLLTIDAEAIWETPFETDDEVWATSISDDGQFIAVGTANKKPLNGTLYVLTRSGDQFWSIRIRSPIWSVKLSTDGAFLIATTWKNEFFIYKRHEGGYKEVKKILISGNTGLYGCAIIENDNQCVVASYDKGLYFYTLSGNLIKEILYNEGLYNLSYSEASRNLFIGLRNGCFGWFKNGDISIQKSLALAQRPICGISATENGILIAAGSFDGRIILANSDGEMIWDHKTEGEVWSTAISKSGSTLVAGCGDHILRVFDNLCNCDAYKEIKAIENSIEYSTLTIDSTTFDTLLRLYKKYQVTQYGYNKLNKFFLANQKLHSYKAKLKDFLLDSISEPETDSLTYYNLGLLLFNEQRYFDAIKYFQIATINRDLKSLSQRKASECFAELGLKTASTSAYRQSREQHLDHESRHILFMLARSYEDSGQWKKAAKLYEMLLSWDVEFRNSYEKLSIATTYDQNSTRRNLAIKSDYTGSTTNLLGSKNIKNVDESLNNIIEARSKEIEIGPENINYISMVAQDLLSDPDYSRGIKRDIAQLDYDKQLFLKYDFGLPEDEMKKFLETVNSYEFFTYAKNLNSIPYSLDVGSATGRYPTLLTRLGFQSYGIDIEKRAISYSNEKKGDVLWPQYICGDALFLDDHLDKELRFNLITCMMGTFEHLPKDKHEILISDLYSKLLERGVCIISIWDSECAHLAYLSIYDEGQKDLIRQNSRTQDEMFKIYKKIGFSDIKIIPFSLMPQTLIYDLGIERFQEEDVEIAIQADLAARAIFSARHGEMFLAVGFK